MGEERTLPLAGLRVLELGHIVAGPTAGQILGDLGAEVIKVESIDGGDQARKMPGATIAMFHFLNRNKRSISLDLKGEGKRIFLRMVESADIVVDNFAYGAVERLGIAFDVVSHLNPRLIWLAIKGYLPGPAESRPMLDELAQMAGGLAFMTGTQEKPMRAGASVIDVSAATYGVIAVLAALRQRDASGVGQFITAGLFETSVYFVSQWMATAQYSGEQSVPMSTVQQDRRMGWGIYQIFETADNDKVFIGVVSDAHWKRFCDAFGLNELYADERFRTNAGRVANRPTLISLVAAQMKRRNGEEILTRLQAASVPTAPLRRPDQLSTDPHLVQSDQLVATRLPNGAEALLPKLPFRASGFDMALRKGAPELGADTRDILLDLGFTSEEINALVARGEVRTCA